MPPERLTRRAFLETTGAAAAAGVGPTIWVRQARAKSDTLKIGQWAHFVPTFDAWFDKKFTKEWGEKNGVKVVVDHISINDIRARAAAKRFQPGSGWRGHAGPFVGPLAGGGIGKLDRGGGIEKPQRGGPLPGR